MIKVIRLGQVEFLLVGGTAIPVEEICSFRKESSGDRDRGKMTILTRTDKFEFHGLFANDILEYLEGQDQIDSEGWKNPS